ncbi:MAG: nicotinamide-nucleotide amidase [Solirubrobacterales bacterium]|jgi:nicotinamide-nucleotide amidase|nr:nicotinamide-nucleotide amidase [Solirubrobacterales bacterium]
MSVRAGILVTGTEVITARISDRNGPWLSQRLAELGVEVAHILVVADRPDDLEAGLRFMAGEGCDLIVTSGGLGPTADDLTAEIVARFAGVELELDEGMEEKIAAIIAGFARRMRFDPEALREANRKQAMIPRGAQAIDPAGTAPGLVVAVEDGPTVIVLPGPPRELQTMWEAAVATDAVREVLAGASAYIVQTVRMFGIPESEIAKSMREIEAQTDLSPLEITTCLRRGEIEIDVRHRPGAERTREAFVGAMVDRHQRFVFSTDGSTIDEQVAALLRDRRRIAVGESCTAGLLAARLADPPGASAYLAGGVVAYSNEAKIDLLGVPADLIERHGAVSPEVAEAMADGAADRFGADLAVGITGIAGPDGGTKEKPVGYVCVCVRVPGGPVLARDPVIPGDRHEIRDRTCTLALHLIRRLLRGEDFPL